MPSLNLNHTSLLPTAVPMESTALLSPAERQREHFGYWVYEFSQFSKAWRNVFEAYKHTVYCPRRKKKQLKNKEIFTFFNLEPFWLKARFKPTLLMINWNFNNSKWWNKLLVRFQDLQLANVITKPEHLCPPFLYFFENIGAGEVNNLDHPVTMQCTGGRCVPRGIHMNIRAEGFPAELCNKLFSVTHFTCLWF